MGSEYNKEAIYKSKILPHIQEIRKVCTLENIPFFCGTAVANNDKETVYKYDGYLPGACGVKLTNNLFGKHLLLARHVPGCENISTENDPTLNVIWDYTEEGFEDTETVEVTNEMEEESW